MSQPDPLHDRPQDPIPAQYPPPAYYPPPGYYYPPPPPPGMLRPPNYLGWAIGSIFLFWPLAIAAIIKSSQVDRLWAEGRYDLSREASNTTKTLCLIATIVAAVLFVFFIVMWVVLWNTIPRYVPTAPR